MQSSKGGAPLAAAGAAVDATRTGEPVRVAWRGRLRYRLSVARHEPTALIAALLSILFVYLVIAPIVSLLADAVRVQFGDVGKIGAPAGALTDYYVQRVFTSPVSTLLFWQPLLHSLIAAVGVTLCTLTIGGALAWLVTRTDMPGRSWFGTVLVVPYMMPSWTFALAWFTLFKNRTAAGKPGLLETMGFAPPDWLAYGPFPIIVALSLHYFPFGFLLIGNALQRFDSQLEESARVLGAGRGTIVRRILVPLMLPAIMSGVVLTFSRVLGTFGTPYVLGLPVNYTLLSTSLYEAFRSGSTGVMAVLSTVIAVIGLGIIAFDTWLLRNQQRFTTVGAKGAMDRRTRLGPWRWAACGGAALAFAASVVAPLSILALSTVMRIQGRFTWDNFTLDYWLAKDIPSYVGYPHGLLRNSRLGEAVWNSISIVGISALVCGLLGLLVGYVIVRLQGGWLAAFLRQVSFLPYLIPGIAFAAAYLSLFAVRRGPIPPLYGTQALLILVFIVANLPYASRSGIAAMTQLGREPEEAAQICGAGWFRRIGRIVIPIQKGALLTGIILPFISGLKELSLVIMLATPGTEVLTTLSISLLDYGYTQLANGAVLLITILAFAVTYLAQRLTGSSLASGLRT